MGDVSRYTQGREQVLVGKVKALIGRRAAEQMLTLMAGNKVANPVQDMGFELMVRESS